uniref:Lantibiotic biosynthesis dehydratase n=1 Tax=Verrucosispora sp. TaxID=1871626 RepID=A0A894JV42_9ACTN|nr:Lantibiotic biosynthesis dehydratase [Verrucosispora sp.]
MTRDWSLYCLRRATPGTADLAVPDVSDRLLAFADALRAADPRARWLFQRLDNGSRPYLGVWTDCDPAAGSGAAAYAALAVDRAAAEVPERYLPPIARYPDGPGRELAELLAMASSELIAETPVPAALPVVVLHLRELVELLPAADRPGFLFTCWQEWSSELGPRRRVELAVESDYQAELLGTAILDPALAGERGPAWAGYLDTLRHVAGAAHTDPQTPLGYLLFDHAHLTHNRLGVTPDLEAMAARLLRAVLRNGSGALATAHHSRQRLLDAGRGGTS